MEELNLNKLKEARQIVFFNNEEFKNKTDFQEENVLYSQEKITYWKHNLAQVLAVANNCEIVYDYNKKGIDCFIFGDTNKTKHIKENFKKACIEINKIYKKFKKINLKNSKTISNSFKHGALSFIVNDVLLKGKFKNDWYKDIKLKNKKIDYNYYNIGYLSMQNHYGN